MTADEEDSLFGEAFTRQERAKLVDGWGYDDDGDADDEQGCWLHAPVMDVCDYMASGRGRKHDDE